MRNLLGGDAMASQSRTPEIMGDAAAAILKKGADFSGWCCMDDLVLAADIAVDLVLDEEALGVELSDPILAVRAVGENAELVHAQREEIELAMGAGMGLIGGLLSFPVDDLGLDGLGLGEGLPTLSFAREPSDRATRIEVDWTAWP